MSWNPVCPLSRLPLERGVAALVDGHQVALFRLGDVVHAVDNLDPRSGAMVLSRGIVGSRGDRVVVASPVYKTVFDLESGACVDDPALSVEVHDVRVVEDLVEVRLRAALPVAG